MRRRRGGRWRGQGDEEEEGGVVPSEIDHLFSPLRSFSSVVVSEQINYGKKKKAAHNNMAEHYFNV